MKTLRFLILSVIYCLTFTMCSAQRDLQALNNINGVQSVYVGKAMLSIAASTMGDNLNTPGFNGSKLMKSITSIEVVTTENKNAFNEANPIIDKYMADNNLETMTEVTEGDEHVLISGETDPKTGNIKKILIKVSEPNELTCVLLKGNITPEMLQEALKK